MLLKKEATLFARDENGELIPQEVPLEIDEKDPEELTYKGTDIKLVPLVRGELRKLFSKLPTKDEEEGKKSEEEYDVDAHIIVNKCKNHSYTEEDVKHMKPVLVTILVNTILFHSGLDTRKSSKRTALEKKEDEFAKN